MMWAEQYRRLEPLTLLSAQWQLSSLECGGQILFGRVFEKRVGMLFAASRNEDGNVHRRDRVSKTVTKNMWDGHFKDQIKERPNLSADKAGNAPFRGKTITADSAERSFHPMNLAGMSCLLSALFSRCARLTLKSAFQNARTTCFYVSLMAVLVRLLASSGCLVDAAVFLIKNDILLIINTLCQFFVDKMFELRVEVCDGIK